jgi:hypothetical protein
MGDTLDRPHGGLLPVRRPFPEYEKIEFRRLGDVSPAALIELMGDLDVRRHMPLARGAFGVSECERFVAAKERMWTERGYGDGAARFS